MIEAWHNLVAQLPFAWAQYAFMQNALLAVLLVTPLFALLGCMVISNQMAFFSEAIGHAALTGIAIGMICGLANPLWSMIALSILLAVGISALRRRTAAFAFQKFARQLVGNDAHRMTGRNAGRYRRTVLGLQNRLLVVFMRNAFLGDDKARSHLNARRAHL